MSIKTSATQARFRTTCNTTRIEHYYEPTLTLNTMEPDAITATTVTFKLTRTTLKNVDDAAGLWQFESGHVSRKGEKVANYSSTKRVTFGGTDSDGQNAATVNTTFLFLGSSPAENITLTGTHTFNSGNQTGSVSAASSSQRTYIGQTYTRNGSTDTVQIG